MPVITGTDEPLKNYQGHEVPPIGTIFPPINLRQSNDPAELQIGNIVFKPTNNSQSDNVLILPNDAGKIMYVAAVSIFPKNTKVIAESQIIDGVTVFEHINRKALEFDVEIFLWTNGYDAIFPQAAITGIWDNIWMPNSVQTIGNTLINGLHVQQAIVKDINIMPRAGSTNVLIKFKLFENQIGGTLILST